MHLFRPVRLTKVIAMPEMLPTPIRALRHGAEPTLPGGLFDTATATFEDGSFLLVEGMNFGVVARRFSREGELLSERPFQSGGGPVDGNRGIAALCRCRGSG